MSAETPSIPSDRRVLFYKRDRAEFGFLSNFHLVPIVVDGVPYPTTEHYYQSQKSLNGDYLAAIMAAPTPGAAKQLAASPDKPMRTSRHSWFRKHQIAPRPDWADVKAGIMRTALRAKFTQHADLAARLIATGDAEIVEDSKYDRFWGIGEDGAGANQMGRLLTELRSELRASAV